MPIFPCSRNDGGKTPGHEHRHRAEEIGRADADRDEREHVEMQPCAATASRARKTASPPRAPTGVLRDELHPARRVARHPVRRAPGTRCAIASRNTGSASAAPIQNRRVMSRSSAFSSGAGARRSSARAPCRTSGSRPDDPARSPDASGRCRSRPGKPAQAPRHASLREARWICVERPLATGRAKVIGRARVPARSGGRLRLDLHSTNRIGVRHREFVRQGPTEASAILLDRARRNCRPRRALARVVSMSASPLSSRMKAP